MALDRWWQSASGAVAHQKCTGVDKLRQPVACQSVAWAVMHTCITTHSSLIGQTPWFSIFSRSGTELPGSVQGFVAYVLTGDVLPPGESTLDRALGFMTRSEWRRGP